MAKGYLYIRYSNMGIQKGRHFTISTRIFFKKVFRKKPLKNGKCILLVHNSKKACFYT